MHSFGGTTAVDVLFGSQNYLPNFCDKCQSITTPNGFPVSLLSQACEYILIDRQTDRLDRTTLRNQIYLVSKCKQLFMLHFYILFTLNDKVNSQQTKPVKPEPFKITCSESALDKICTQM